MQIGGYFVVFLLFFFFDGETATLRCPLDRRLRNVFGHARLGHLDFKKTRRVRLEQVGNYLRPSVTPYHVGAGAHAAQFRLLVVPEHEGSGVIAIRFGQRDLRGTLHSYVGPVLAAYVLASGFPRFGEHHVGHLVGRHHQL